MAIPPAVIAAAPLLDIGAKIFGGLLGKSSAKKQNQANLAIAREQMAFQERMSNTAHQREVKDLRSAGLNPILSAGGKGASTPGGASAQFVGEDTTMANTLSQGLSSAVQIANTIEQTENIAAQKRTQDQITRKTKFEASNEFLKNQIMEAIYKSGGQEKRFAQELRKIIAESNLLEAQLPGAQAEAGVWEGFKNLGPEDSSGDSAMKTIMMIMRMLK